MVEVGALEETLEMLLPAPEGSAAVVAVVELLSRRGEASLWLAMAVLQEAAAALWPRRLRG